MKSWMIYSMVFVLAIGGGSLLAEDAKKGEKKTPEEVFKHQDKDSNGKISLDEFVGKKKDEKKTKAEAAFKAKDKDNDGSLSLDEFKAKGGKKKGDKKPDAKKSKKKAQ